MNLRQMLETDLDRVAENEFSAYAFPWTRNIFTECLKADNECWVAEVDTTIVGHSVISVGAGEAHLLNVCVQRDVQGLGYGRDLVMHALHRSHTCGADALFLEVRPSNHVAIRLYDSLGFSEVGVRKNYYPAHLGHEDARVLVLDLEAHFGR